MQKSELTEIINGVKQGDRRSLAKSITLSESSMQSNSDDLEEVLAKLSPLSGNSIRIGISGVPGAGKSTFIETLGLKFIEKGHKVAVLAIDPSSPKSGGSILGDKTRMELLSQNKNAFIRPSPTKESLGGVTKSTREAIVLCEAAGHDVILIETVGVGQSEYIASSMVDLFCVLMLPNAGDELQGIKKGIIELADMLIINKSDGTNIAQANIAKNQYENALHIVQRDHFWSQSVHNCSSLEKTGFDDIFDDINKFIKESKSSHYFELNRKEQIKTWFKQSLERQFFKLLSHNPFVSQKYTELEADIEEKVVTPYSAARQIINLIETKLSKTK
jgi:LAO/AO transport system kinase